MDFEQFGWNGLRRVTVGYLNSTLKYYSLDVQEWDA